MKIKKYFWELKEKALEETEDILKNPAHPKFFQRIINLLSRCQKPKEVFALISKEQFIENWPKIKRHWQKINPSSLDFRDWWQTIYEGLLEEYKSVYQKPRGNSLYLLIKLGKIIQNKRIKLGLSQNEPRFNLPLPIGFGNKKEEAKKHTRAS